MSKGILYKTKCTVIGPMQYSAEEGQKVRNFISEQLSKIGVTVFNHYENPFLSDHQEDIDSIHEVNEYIKNGEFEKVEEKRFIRSYDLALIDRSDFIIFMYHKNIPMFGSFEEFFLANRQKKPIFVVCGDGKRNASAWLYWTIPHKYCYDSLETCLDMINKINDGVVKIDSSRWRLLKPEFR